MNWGGRKTLANFESLPKCGTGKTGETGGRILDCELGRIVNWAQATSLRQRGVIVLLNGLGASGEF